MKNLFFILLTIFLSQNGFSKAIENDSSQYFIQGFNHSIKLTLLPNYTFIYETWYFDCVNTTYSNAITGNYTQKNNEIQLIPKRINRSEQTGDIQKDTSILYAHWFDKIKTHYYQVDINGFSYLLSDEYYRTKTNDFEALVKVLQEGNNRNSPIFLAIKQPERIFTINDLPEQRQKLLKPFANTIYKVQLGAFQNPENFDKSIIEGLGEISYLKTENGLTLILLGIYKTYSEAKICAEKIKTNGGEAMVVVIENGKKVPLK